MPKEVLGALEVPANKEINMAKKIEEGINGPLFPTIRPKAKSKIKRDAGGTLVEIIPGGVAVGEASPLKDNFRAPGTEKPAVFKNVDEMKHFLATTDFNKPLVTDEEMDAINRFYLEHEYQFNPNDPWIQTYTGRRFTPTNPNPSAIVIQDIARALSMQCRFSGHLKYFYSVAQHCVLVSYICDSADALWGLLHDATEAYLIDLPAPLKRSGQFDNFKMVEHKLMKAICTKFKLPFEEPPSVKAADVQLLVTEARDLMVNKRSDWELKVEPLPFKIEAWTPDQAEDNFMKRFGELTKHDNFYEHYLHYKYGDSK